LERCGGGTIGAFKKILFLTGRSKLQSELAISGISTLWSLGLASLGLESLYFLVKVLGVSFQVAVE